MAKEKPKSLRARLGTGTTPLWFPILLGVLAVIFCIAVLVAWNIIFTRYYMLATYPSIGLSLGFWYWFTLVSGCLFLIGIITVLVLGLVVNVRQTLYVRLQKTFIDSVTHELKSPLASIRLGLDTMEMREMSPDVQARFITMMRKDVDRLQAFIEHILESGRLEHNTRPLDLQPTHIYKLATSVVEAARRRHSLTEDTISLSVSPTSLEQDLITTDAIALEIVLTNLIDNAVKYSPPDRVHVTLHMHTNPSEDTLNIEVSDQGIGLARKQLKKVFTRFYRVEHPDATWTQAARGTGLGLHVVRALVHRLKGRIEATSAGIHKGTLFRVTLPLSLSEEP